MLPLQGSEFILKNLSFFCALPGLREVQLKLPLFPIFIWQSCRQSRFMAGERRRRLLRALTQFAIGCSRSNGNNVSAVELPLSQALLLPDLRDAEDL
jgi:hypothetical protein